MKEGEGGGGGWGGEAEGHQTTHVTPCIVLPRASFRLETCSTNAGPNMVAGPSVEIPYLVPTRARLERREREFVRRAGLILQTYQRHLAGGGHLGGLPLPIPPRWDLAISSHAWERQYRQWRDEILSSGPPDIRTDFFLVEPERVRHMCILLGSYRGCSKSILFGKPRGADQICRRGSLAESVLS